MIHQGLAWGFLGSHYKQQGLFAPRTLLRFLATTTVPAESLSPSTDFPVLPVIRFPCSADFSTGRGGLLQLLGMTLSPCCPFSPAEVLRRVSPCDARCCLRPRSEGSAFGVQYSRGHTGSLALRPGDSLTILLDGLSIGFRIISFLPSFLLFKLRGFGLLPRWDFHPLFMPAFAGRTLPGTDPIWVRNAVTLRIPSDDDKRSELMPITIPRLCR
jgi:hypothetical protein